MKKRKLKKLISFITAGLLTLNQIGFVPELWAVSPREVKVPSSGFRLALPPELGTIQALHSGNGPSLIHIQTAHGNYEAQKKIQAILHYLKDTYGFKLLLLEGSASRLNPELLKFFPKRMDLTMKIAEELTKEALVKGDELFLLEESDAEAYGIEDIPAYRKTREAFKAVILQKEKTEKFIQEMDLQIERLTGPYLNKNLRSFLRRFEAFESKTLPLLDWLSELNTQAKRALDLGLTDPLNQLDWPMLLRIFKLREFESKIDPNAFAKERDQFLTEITPSLRGATRLRVRQSRERRSPDAAGVRTNEDSFNRPFLRKGRSNLRVGIASASVGILPRNDFEQIEKLLSSPLSQNQLPDPETGLLFERMVEALPESFNYDTYPNVKLFIGHLILQSELKGERLMEEMNRVMEKISGKLAKTEEEKKILSLLKDHRLLKRLFALELTPEDYDVIARRAELPDSSLRGGRQADEALTPLASGLMRIPLTVPSVGRDEAISESDFLRRPPHRIGWIPRNDILMPSNFIRRFLEINHTKRVRNLGFSHLEEIDSLFDKALEFYRGVKERDRWMLEKIQARLSARGGSLPGRQAGAFGGKETGQDKAVVITGGFHAGPFQDFFQRQGYNYALIAPKITSPEGREAYLRVVLQNSSPALKKATMETTRLTERAEVRMALGDNLSLMHEWTRTIRQRVIKQTKELAQEDQDTTSPTRAEVRKEKSVDLDFVKAVIERLRLYEAMAEHVRILSGAVKQIETLAAVKGTLSLDIYQTLRKEPARRAHKALKHLFVLEKFKPDLIDLLPDLITAYLQFTDIRSPEDTMGILDFDLSVESERQRPYEDFWSWALALSFHGGKQAIDMLGKELKQVGNEIFDINTQDYHWSVAYQEILLEAIFWAATDSDEEVAMKQRVLQEALTYKSPQVKKLAAYYLGKDLKQGDHKIANYVILLHYVLNRLTKGAGDVQAYVNAVLKDKIEFLESSDTLPRAEVRKMSASPTGQKPEAGRRKCQTPFQLQASSVQLLSAAPRCGN